MLSFKASPAGPARTGVHMNMLYNSDNFVVVHFDLGDAESGVLGRGGYEIVDKFARKEIYLEGAAAQGFREGVQSLMQKGPSEDELDEFIGRYTQLAQQPVVLH